MSHTAYMTRYMTRVGKEPKGKPPYSSLVEAKVALGEDFHWKNVRFREVGGVLRWPMRAGRWIPVESTLSASCRRCVHKGPTLAQNLLISGLGSLGAFQVPAC